MSRKENNERKFYIPIDGKLCETSEEVYKAYYKMGRRERYLEEVCQKNNLSFDALRMAEYPVEANMHQKHEALEDGVVETLMIELMLSKLSILTDYEMWLVKELYLYEKSERQIERESEIPRKTLSYQKKKMLNKLRHAMNHLD